MTAGAKDLSVVKRVVVPRELADGANSHLREAGQRSCEAFALWAGSRQDSVFLVKELIIPAQQALAFEDGVCVTVASPELFRINVHLHNEGLELIAQLHSHPNEAYHSETDDRYPIATRAGALSIVVPNFARATFAIESSAVFRLSARSEWIAMSADEACRLIRVADDEEIEALASAVRSSESL